MSSGRQRPYQKVSKCKIEQPAVMLRVIIIFDLVTINGDVYSLESCVCVCVCVCVTRVCLCCDSLTDIL